MDTDVRHNDRSVALNPSYAFPLSTHCAQAIGQKFDSHSSSPIVVTSRSSRASPETSQSRNGMRRPAGWLVTMSPGRRPATPPFRHYERNARMRYVKLKSTATLCNARWFHRSASKTRVNALKGGPGAKNRRRGAPRGGHPRRADCVSGWRGMQGRAFSSCGPASLAREGVAIHPERLSALRSLALSEGNCKPRRAYASRERRRMGALSSFRDASLARGPGIHTPQPWLWIPGSPLSRRPGMTAEWVAAAAVTQTRLGD